MAKKAKVPAWRPQLMRAVTDAIIKHGPKVRSAENLMHVQIACILPVSSVHAAHFSQGYSMELAQHMAQAGIEAMERARVDWEQHRN